jgi:lipopolysaccharide/colanic/teichoic acid biosynthesis glycosyltransferase
MLSDLGEAPRRVGGMRFSAPTSKSRFLPRVTPFDAILVIVAPFAALALRDDSLLRFDLAALGSREVYQYALITIVCALPSVAAFRLCDALGRDFAFVDVFGILGAAGVASSTSAALTFTVNRLDAIPRSTPLIYAIVLVAGLAGGRAIVRAAASRRMAQEESGGERPRAQCRRVIVVGVDRFSTLAIKLAQCQSPRAVEIVAALDPRDRLVGRTVNGVRIVGAPADLSLIAREYAEHGVCVDEVWVSDVLIAQNPEILSGLSDASVHESLRCSSVSGALNLVPAQSTIEARSDAVSRAAVAPAPLYFRFRRPVEAVASFALLVILAPVAIAVAAIVALDVGAPIVFWQERIGRNGRKFLLYKFRTFRAPFDRDGGAIPREKRLSRIGALIRKTRLDEVPQLWNVVRGEMSLIGPRPLLPVDQPADPRTRLLVRPGVTGWAQINGATALTADEKDALDAWYIRHASLGLDLRVALRTIVHLGQGERKDAAAIEEALEWRRKMQDADVLRQFADRAPAEHEPDEERRPAIAFFSRVKAVS